MRPRKCGIRPKISLGIPQQFPFTIHPRAPPVILTTMLTIFFSCVSEGVFPKFASEAGLN